MYARFIRPIAAALLAFQFAACHQRPPAPKPVVKHIAVIPATTPRTYTLYNQPPLVGYPMQHWVNKADSGNKEQFLNQRLSFQPLDLGGELTADVVEALRAHGIAVEVLENLQRPADSPDNVDYDKLKIHADVILHLYFSEVGLYSGRNTVYYGPRVNAVGIVFVPGQDDSLYHEDICYGVDARKGKAWAIEPDPRYAWRYFDDAMAQLDDVRASFETGTHEVAKRMAEQIYEAVR